MTAFHGKVGSGSFDGTTFELLSWSVEGTADVAEATDMADTDKIYLAGFKDWTATCECNLPALGGTIAVLGASGTLAFVSGGKTYGGTAICTGFAPSADKDGIARLTYTFQGNGALGET